jgi:hypothetical protein
MFKINLKRKVVLSKIPGNVLVCDRRSNNLYARLRRNYSSLKYYLFRSNIITFSRTSWNIVVISVSNRVVGNITNQRG